MVPSYASLLLRRSNDATLLVGGNSSNSLPAGLPGGVPASSSLGGIKSSIKDGPLHLGLSLSGMSALTHLQMCTDWLQDEGCLGGCNGYSPLLLNQLLRKVPGSLDINQLLLKLPVQLKVSLLQSSPCPFMLVHVHSPMKAFVDA